MSTASTSLTTPTRAARRASIEAAATRLFAARGYAATTVDEIVREAGVTKPMLYRHWDSKRELCIALLERSRDELIAAPLARFDSEAADRRAQLAPMLDAWLGYVDSHRDAARLLFTPIVGDPEVKRVQRELHARQRDTQVALLREFAPLLPEAEAEPLGELLRSGLGAIALWWIEHPEVPRALPLAVLLRLSESIVGSLEADASGAVAASGEGVR